MCIKIKDEFDKNTVLRVDVSNSSEEEKKKVQDVFFALGYPWCEYGESYQYYSDNVKSYVNARAGDSETNSFLMYGTCLSDNSYIQPDEFFDLVLEEDSVGMDHIIQEALKGHPVKLRNGLKAYVRYKEEELNNILVGVVLLLEGADIINWISDGKHSLNSEYDIIGLWKEPLKFKYWDILNKDIKYIAKDSCGSWYGYDELPLKDSKMWVLASSEDSYYEVDGDVFVIDLPECDWEDSLIKRPEC